VRQISVAGRYRNEVDLILTARKNRAFAMVCFDPNYYGRRLKIIRKIIATLMAALSLGGLFGTLPGGNTMQGAGRDIQQGGKAISDEAKEQKDKR
jgi:predicted small secreted protein